MLDLPGFQVNEKIYESIRSVVYRANHVHDDRPVILKTLREEFPAPEEILRYRREYETTRRLEAEGTPRPIGLEKISNRLVLVSEDIGGQDLKTLLRTRTFTLEQLLQIAIRTVQVLGQIHAASLIHGDIKTANIIFNPETRHLQIIDFGSSYALTEAAAGSEIRNMSGTLSYMSPEQTGRMNRPVDWRTDFYSLGIVFYELFTTTLPFVAGDSLELVHSHIARRPQPPQNRNSEVPEGLSDLIMKLLAKNPEDRYQSARGIEADLSECLTRLQNTGHIKTFPLARHDISDKFQVSRKLVGRETEINTIETAYDRVSRGGKELLLVAGPAGIGKTALVLEAGKSITRRQGLFLHGQFDPAERSRPYAGIVSAIQDLVRRLMTESRESLIQWHDRILAAVGGNGQVLLDLVPEAATVIGDQSPVGELEPAAAQRRIKLVLKKFMQVFCRPQHPLVLFLDALNLADPASMDFLQALMEDEEIDFLFIVGAFRNEAVDTHHPLYIVRQKLEQQRYDVEQIDLQGLRQEHVSQIVAGTLQCDSGEADVLARTLIVKTQGNPFFVNELLTNLHSEKLLYFENGRQRWQWDATAISNRMITDNVVDLLAAKLQRLGDETLSVITKAAVIGSQFDLRTLSVACEAPREKMAAAFRQAMAQGMIMPIGQACVERYWDSGMEKLVDTPCEQILNCEFKFAHDQLHQAAYDLIPESERPQHHHQIGMLLKQRMETEEVEEILFQVADQLNAGRQMVSDEKKHAELAELNLAAGKKAKAAAVFDVALEYFKTGLNVLGENCWESNYDLALALHTEAAEGAYLCNDIGEMENLVRAVLDRARNPLDQAFAYEVKIQSLTAQNRWAEAAQAALEILKKLGLDLPTKPNKFQMKQCALKSKIMLARKPFDRLANLPPMTDPSKIAVMRILMRANAPLTTIYPELFPVMAGEMMRMTVLHGSGPVTSSAYMNYGILLGSGGDMESGYRFGRLALQYLEQPQAEVSRIPTRFTFNFVMGHWKAHLRETLAPILEIHQAAQESGDPFYIAYTGAYHGVHMFYSSRELPSIEQAMAEHEAVIKATGVDSAYHFMQLYRQAVDNLMNTVSDPCRLAGTFYDEAKMLDVDMEADNRGRDLGLYNSKLLLCLLYRHYDRAVKNAERVERVLKGGWTLGSSVPPFYCWKALAYLGCYPDAGTAEKGHILKKVEDAQAAMHRWARQSPVNYRHKYELVNAVRHWVLGHDAAAMTLFDQVIGLAKANDYLYDEAMANELAARFYLQRDRLSIARAYMAEARYAYLRWGAAAKVQDIDETFPELMPVLTAPAPSVVAAGSVDVTTASSDSAEVLDMASVLKSTQAMSGEIVLDTLLKKLLNIMMENAGAQRGFLVLDDDKRLRVEAEATVDLGETIVRQSKPLDLSDALSRSIVNYVARTRTEVLLEDASKEGKFADTPYVIKNRPRSILCMPLTAKDKLVGILYLENNLATGVFTRGHLETLTILSSQAVISLENARLYDRLADYSRSLEEIIEALNLAQEVQQNLLPQKSPRLESIDIAGRSLYCDETGGDYYDFIKLPDDRLGIVVGDVSGHGVSAALLMASVRGFLRARASLPGSTAEIIDGVNQLISVDTAETGQFMTLFYLVVAAQKKRITWVRAGHDPAILYCPETDRFDELTGAGMALGVSSEWQYEDYSREIQPGQIVLLTTDGIFEAHNAEGKMFGKARFKAIVRQNAALEAEGIRKAVMEAVSSFRGNEPQEDDITLVVLKFS